MRNLSLLAVVVGAVSISVSAEAAPPTVAPAERPVVQRVQPNLALASIEVKVLTDEEQKCGEDQHVKVELINHTSKAFLGDVILLTQGIKGKVTVSLPESGKQGSTGVVPVTAHVKLDCTKVLPIQEISVGPSGVPEKAFFKKNFKPAKLTGAQGFPPPAGMNDPRPWLRRAILELTCGQASNGYASVQNFSQKDQQATVKMAFGGQPLQDVTITVPPQGNQSATLPIPAVDCGAPIGSLDYNLVTGVPHAGKLSIDTVTYAVVP